MFRHDAQGNNSRPKCAPRVKPKRALQRPTKSCYRSNSGALLWQIRIAIVSAEDRRHPLLQPLLLSHAPDAIKASAPRFLSSNTFTVAVGDAFNHDLIFIV